MLRGPALSLKLGPDRVSERAMPVEVFDIREFIELSDKAKYCVVKRSGEVAKLKLRAGRYLYTLKVDPAKVDEVLKQLKCEVREAK